MGQTLLSGGTLNCLGTVDIPLGTFYHCGFTYCSLWSLPFQLSHRVSRSKTTSFHCPEGHWMLHGQKLPAPAPVPPGRNLNMLLVPPRLSCPHLTTPLRRKMLHYPHPHPRDTTTPPFSTFTSPEFSLLGNNSLRVSGTLSTCKGQQPPALKYVLGPACLVVHFPPSADQLGVRKRGPVHPVIPVS